MTLPIADTAETAGPGGTVTEDPPRAAGLGRAWRAFLLRRGIGLVVNLVLLVVVTFLIVQLIPGDPATAIAGENASLAQVELVRTQLGLDQPLPVQLWTYVTSVAQLDFGDSFKYRIPAMDVVMAAAPNTLALTIPAVILLLVLGLALG